MDLLGSFQSPVLILAGHFGSGKTEIAVNLALALALDACEPDGLGPAGSIAGGSGNPVRVPRPNARRQVNLVDLDLVKPYFRCRLARDAVQPRGIRLVAPEGELSQADLPILLPEIAGYCARTDEVSILDVGGDDSGARVLGALGRALHEGNHELLLVINARRPSTEDADSTLAVMGEIEGAARLRVTGLVSNTHLMGETTPAIVRDGIALCREVAARSGRPLRFACVEETLAPSLHDLDVPLLPLRRHILPPFLKRPMSTRLSV